MSKNLRLSLLMGLLFLSTSHSMFAGDIFGDRYEHIYCTEQTYRVQNLPPSFSVMWRWSNNIDVSAEGVDSIVASIGVADGNPYWLEASIYDNRNHKLGSDTLHLWAHYLTDCGIERMDEQKVRFSDGKYRKQYVLRANIGGIDSRDARICWQYRDSVRVLLPWQGSREKCKIESLGVIVGPNADAMCKDIVPERPPLDTITRNTSTLPYPDTELPFLADPAWARITLPDGDSYTGYIVLTVFDACCNRKSDTLKVTNRY